MLFCKGLEADVLGLAQHQQEVDNANPELERAINQFAILFDGRVSMGGFNQNSLTQTA
jgi:hypothetical protein